MNNEPSIKLTYNLQKDVESGAIKIYCPNTYGRPPDTWESIVINAKFHGYTELAYCINTMSMWHMNYGSFCGKTGDERKWVDEHYKFVSEYLEALKDKRKYKCKECGWRGKRSEMPEGIFTDYACPQCNSDWDLGIK